MLLPSTAIAAKVRMRENCDFKRSVKKEHKRKKLASEKLHNNDDMHINKKVKELLRSKSRNRNYVVVRTACITGYS